MADNKFLRYSKFYTDLNELQAKAKDAGDTAHFLNEDEQIKNALNKFVSEINFYIAKKAKEFGKDKKENGSV